jgi:hypothetical protein
LILSNGSDFTLSSAVLDNQLGAGIYFNNGSITVSGSGIATNSGLLNLDSGSVFQFSGATLELGGTVNAPAQQQPPLQLALRRSSLRPTSPRPPSGCKPARSTNRPTSS